MITEVQTNLLKEVIVETMHPKKVHLFGSLLWEQQMKTAIWIF